MKTASSRLEDFARIELTNLVLGEKIGSGCYRDVYAYALDPDVVVKIEMKNGSFANVLEWEFWCHNQHDPKIEKFLAPCLYISPSGLVLLQKRTYPIVDKKKLPKRVPKLLDDHHDANWGHLGYGGPVVCHDYGNLRLHRNFSKKSNRLTSAEW